MSLIVFSSLLLRGAGPAGSIPFPKEPLCALSLRFYRPFSCSVPLSALAALACSAAEDREAVIAADNGWEKAEESGRRRLCGQPAAAGLSLSERGRQRARQGSDRGQHPETCRLAGIRGQGAEVDGRLIRCGRRRAQGRHGDCDLLFKSLGPEKGIMSSDIFTSIDGGWHAIYSQHTDAGK